MKKNTYFTNEKQEGKIKITKFRLVFLLLLITCYLLPVLMEDLILEIIKLYEE